MIVLTFLKRGPGRIEFKPSWITLDVSMYMPWVRFCVLNGVSVMFLIWYRRGKYKMSAYNKKLNVV
jgi:hypothetical protein